MFDNFMLEFMTTKREFASIWQDPHLNKNSPSIVLANIVASSLILIGGIGGILRIFLFGK